MRKLVISLIALGVLALVAVAAYVYMQRENLLQRAIEHYGSEILGASVKVEGVELSPADGNGAVRGLRIGAPARFSKDVARVGAIELAVEPKTVTDEVIRIRRIAILEPHIAYEQGAAGTNFDALQRNVARYIGDTSPTERKAATKFIVDRLVIRGAQLTYVPLSGASSASIALRLPDITLTDIGKRNGGVTAGELTKAIVDTLIARMANALGQRLMEQTVDRLFKR